MRPALWPLAASATPACRLLDSEPCDQPHGHFVCELQLRTIDDLTFDWTRDRFQALGCLAERLSRRPLRPHVVIGHLSSPPHSNSTNVRPSAYHSARTLLAQYIRCEKSSAGSCVLQKPAVLLWFVPGPSARRGGGCCRTARRADDARSGAAARCRSA